MLVVTSDNGKLIIQLEWPYITVGKVVWLREPNPIPKGKISYSYVYNVCVLAITMLWNILFSDLQLHI